MAFDADCYNRVHNPIKMYEIQAPSISNIHKSGGTPFNLTCLAASGPIYEVYTITFGQSMFNLDGI